MQVTYHGDGGGEGGGGRPSVSSLQIGAALILSLLFAVMRAVAKLSHVKEGASHPTSPMTSCRIHV